MIGRAIFSIALPDGNWSVAVRLPEGAPVTDCCVIAPKSYPMDAPVPVTFDMDRWLLAEPVGA